MSAIDNTPRLPPTFNRLAWSNLAAQSAEQVALAAAPIVAVLLLGEIVDASFDDRAGAYAAAGLVTDKLEIRHEAPSIRDNAAT